MYAWQWDGRALDLVELPAPHPGPGEALVRVEAAGLCHSDLTIMDREPSTLPFELPIVLGHEMAGTVVDVAPGVTTLSVGDAVAGYGLRGCTTCSACAAGSENYCRVPTSPPIMPGIGAPGALAEFVVAPAHCLVPAGGLDPAQAATLTDAGLTPFAAIRRALPKGGGTAAVVGVGGLGHVALQLLRASGTRVIAIDVTEDKLRAARTWGADFALLSGGAVVHRVRELTHGRGVDAVFDFVASDATLAAGATMLAPDGTLSIVGLGPGRIPVGMHAVPLGTCVDTPFWGSLPELHEVLALATHGVVEVAVEAFAMSEAAHAYDLLRRGEITGRAVVRPWQPTTGADT